MEHIKRITSTILCICIFMISGCGGDGGERSVSCTAEMVSKNESVSGKNSGSLDQAENNMSGASDTSKEEAASKAENELGMPLMEETVLLVTVTRYRSSDDYQCMQAQYEYDSQGNILRAIELEAGRIDYSNTEYEYDAEGRLSRKTRYEADWRECREENWELSYRVEYGYVENETDGTINRVERKYDRDGILCEELFYDSREQLLKKMLYRDNALSYEYDRQGNQSWEVSYDKDGNISAQYRKEYDARGNLILHAQYDGEGNLDVFEGYECDTYVVIYPYWRYENTYDDNGNLISQIIYNYDNVETDSREYSYDEAGRLVRIFFSDEMVMESTEYEYDSAGNQIKAVLTYYEHDDAGNLTAQEPDTVWEREYDQENRLVKYTDYDWGSPEYWYVYEYALMSGAEEYPYDKVKTKQYF